MFGKTKDQHDENFSAIKNLMKEYGLQENQEKRIECCDSVKFLGYNISYNKIPACLERAQGILEYPSPKTKKELQRFLGILNYGRMFIDKLTEKINPLYKLLEKEKKIEWSTIEINNFSQIKIIWKKNLELVIPDIKSEFVLETDASDVGIVSVLRQNNLPVAYASRSLSGSEKRYTITEKEVLAILWSMEKL